MSEGRSIHKIIEISKRDFKATVSNPIVILILIGIIILPSLYALLNVEACWDPYSNTGDMPFAIANLDNGSSYQNQNINVGQSLVNELQNNTDFNWTFVSENELREGVENGTYYAGIIIPQNFSSNIISIVSDDPHSAHMIYIVNIKTNPTASKLSETATKMIYMRMNAKIVEFINLAAYGRLGELQSALSSGAGQLSSGAGQLAAGSAQISGGASQVSAGAGAVSNGASQVSAGASQMSGAANQIDQGSQQIQSSAQHISSLVDPTTLPSGPTREVVQGSINLANGSSNLASQSSQLARHSVNLSNGASQVALGSEDLANGALSLAAGSQLLSQSAVYALYAAASALSGASAQLDDVTGVNETQLGNYFLSPVELDEEKLNPTDNYGSQVAPFYIVLSMWVGAIITCVMLKVGRSSGTKYSPLEMYFGKISLFNVMAILQTTVTIIGSFLLGLKISDPIMFIFSAYVVALVFMTLVYSFISALGHLGEGISVLLLVLQIMGTGGVYPIDIMHPFFKTLYPYLPMTYAIKMLREVMLGLLWSNYIPACLIIIILGIVTIIVAVIVKDKADNIAHYFENKLEESGLF